MTRYAIYFAPEVDSPWWQAGNRWLGRDAQSGEEYPLYPVPGMPASLRARIINRARHYGFHATLKAPFRLRQGFREADLLGMAEEFSRACVPIRLEDLRVRTLARTLSLRPSAPQGELFALAQACARYFDILRAPLSEAELAKRRAPGLSPRQEELLLRWGYPYTEEEFRFHMTLTDSLDGLSAPATSAVRRAAEECFAVALNTSLIIEGICVLVEREDRPFQVLQRFPFMPWHQSILERRMTAALRR